jgi:acrosin
LERRLAPACLVSGQNVICDSSEDHIEVRITSAAIGIYNWGGFEGNVAQGSISISAGAGPDRLEVDDSAFNSGETYHVDAAQIAVGSFLTTNFTNVETLQLLTASGSNSSHDTIYVNSTPSGSTLQVWGGQGNDSFQVAFFTPHLIALGGPVSLDGGFGNNSVTVWDDGGSPGNGTYTITSNWVARTGAPTTTYDEMGSLVVYAAGGNNTINIDSTFTSTRTIVDAGAGDDTFMVTYPSGNLNNLGSVLEVYGSVGTDNLLVWDDLVATGSVYEIYKGGTVDGVVNRGAEQIWYDEVEGLMVNAAPNDNFIHVDSTPAGASTVINAGGGNDSITLADISGNLSSLGGPVTVNGNAGIDTMSVWDTAYASTGAYSVTDTSLARTGVFATNYGTIESLFVNGGSGDSNFFVFSTHTGGSTRVNGGAGNNQFHVTSSSGNLGNLGGPLTMTGAGGTDSLTVWDDLSTSSGAYTITATSVARIGAQTTTYGTFESLTLHGADGSNTININSTLVGGATTVNGGDGNDSVLVTPSSGNLILLGGPLTVNGQNNFDTLSVFDNFASHSGAYTITNTSVQVTGLETTTYGSVEGLLVNAASGNNLISINSTLVGGTTTINAGGGNDAVNVTFASGTLSSLGGPLTVNGQAGTDSLSAYDDLASHSGTYSVSNTSVQVTGLQTTTYGSLESLLVSAASGNNLININSTLLGGTTALNAGGGNDGINVAQFFHNLIDLGGPLTINGQGGTDVLAFFDGLNGNPDAYTVNSGSLLRTGAQTTTYGTVESLTLNAGAGQNTININSTLAVGTTTINAGAGNDIFNLTPTSQELGNLGGALILNGNAGTNTINANDAQNANGTANVVSSSGNQAGQLQVPADSVSVNFQGVGALNLHVRRGNQNNVNTSGYNPAHFDLNVIWALLNPGIDLTPP